MTDIFETEDVPTLGERLRDHGIESGDDSVNCYRFGLEYVGRVSTDAVTDHHGLDDISPYELRTGNTYGVPAYVMQHTHGPDAYGTDLVSQSNFEVMHEDFHVGVDFREVHYVNTTGIVFLETDRVSDELWEVLEGLGDYPLISEDRYLTLEMKYVDECWESYGAHDFKRALEDELGEDYADMFPDVNFDDDNGDVYALWLDAAEWTNTYPMGDEPDFGVDECAAWLVERAAREWMTPQVIDGQTILEVTA